MKKICVVTGSRAEYGLLKPFLRKCILDSEVDLYLVVTGSHLSEEFGLTYQEIIMDDFLIFETIDININPQTEVGICNSIGLGVISFGNLFQRLKPDMLVVLGDRYEIWACCISATINNIPIAHIHGGEVTEGSIDEVIRHGITKMSYIHFTSHDEYRKRVIQLGESPNRVFNVGALGLENINHLQLISRDVLSKAIDFDLSKDYAIFTYHPPTLDNNNIVSIQKDMNEIFNALNKFKDLRVLFCKANTDFNGNLINKLIKDYLIENNDKGKLYDSLGQEKYLSAMKYTKFVIGNSSSGIIEAPYMNIPTINIGSRQSGRFSAESIINVECYEKDISSEIDNILSKNQDKTVDNISNIPNINSNIETTSSKILYIIKAFIEDYNLSIKKEFYDVDFDDFGQV